MLGLIFILTTIAVCSGQQKTDTRCSIYDNRCQQNFFQTVARTYAYTGIPAQSVPVIDPYKLKNVKLSILGLLEVILHEGDAVGIGKCIVTNFNSEVEARSRVVEFICDKIVIKGHFSVKPTSVLGDICGWCNINANGNGSITIEDWYFKIQYPFRLVKREDDKIYLDALFDKAVYEAQERKVSVEADCIKNGNRDITKNVVSFINNNWEAIMNSYIGKFINDASVAEYYKIYNLFYKKNPAVNFLKDDLTSLVENKSVGADVFMINKCF